MNLFDKLVSEALIEKPLLSSLRMIVEKELLHHDILRILSENDFLGDELTFIEGTCLRMCYGSVRLSEDLDFTGGASFTRESLCHMGAILVKSLKEKYELQVSVAEPIRDKNNVDTWKIKVETRPTQRDMPAQRINIDICSIPSYDPRPLLLINHYGTDMGTTGLIVKAQSREEIYTDKLLAFAFRPNRLKYRDLWDISWLHQQGLTPHFYLIPQKLEDHNNTCENFLQCFDKRRNMLTEDLRLASEFSKEMHRFLAEPHLSRTINKDNLWQVITYLLADLSKELHKL